MFTSDNAILMRLPPQAISSATNTTSFQLDRSRECAVILMVGDTTTTVAFKLQSSPDNTTWTDITGKAIATFTATDDNKEAVINLRSDEMPAGHNYVRAVVTPDGASATVAVIAIGDVARYSPAQRISTVAQVVS
jgi:hypothetical protein